MAHSSFRLKNFKNRKTSIKDSDKNIVMDTKILAHLLHQKVTTENVLEGKNQKFFGFNPYVQNEIVETPYTVKVAQIMLKEEIYYENLKTIAHELSAFMMDHALESSNTVVKNLFSKISDTVKPILCMQTNIWNEMQRRWGEWNYCNPNFASSFYGIINYLERLNSFLQLSNCFKLQLKEHCANDWKLKHTLLRFNREKLKGLRREDEDEEALVICVDFIPNYLYQSYQYAHSYYKSLPHRFFYEKEYALIAMNKVKLVIEALDQIQDSKTEVSIMRHALKKKSQDMLSVHEKVHTKIKSDEVTFISNGPQPCFLTLFDDKLIIFLLGPNNKYKIERQIQEKEEVKVLEVEGNPLRFTILCPERAYTIEHRDRKEADRWMNAINSVFQNKNRDQNSLVCRSRSMPDDMEVFLSPDSAIFERPVASCMRCYSSFTTWFRRNHCVGCGFVICKDCYSFASIEHTKSKVCYVCYEVLKKRRRCNITRTTIEQGYVEKVHDPLDSKKIINQSWLTLTSTKDDNICITGYRNIKDDKPYFELCLDKETCSMAYSPCIGGKIKFQIFQTPQSFDDFDNFWAVKTNIFQFKVLSNSAQRWINAFKGFGLLEERKKSETTEPEKKQTRRKYSSRRLAKIINNL